MLNYLLQTGKKPTIYMSSSNGDDVYGDGSIENPYASLSKLESVIQNNDYVVFKKGDVFNGNITLNGYENLKFDSYGSGDKPIIRGAMIIDSDISQNGNIWSYSSIELPNEDNYIQKIYEYIINTVSYVAINGIKGSCGRFPKQGNYYIIDTGTSGYCIDNDLTYDDNHWDGCEIYNAPEIWRLIKKRVTTFASNRFDFRLFGDLQIDFPTGTGSNYFIRNHVNCLSEQNEWAFDTDNNTLYIYSETPVTEIVVSKGNNYGMTMQFDNCNNISIKNLEFNISATDAIYFNSGESLNVANCDFKEIGNYCINVYDTNDISISGISIDVANSGVHFENTNESQIISSNFKNIALNYGDENTDTFTGKGVALRGAKNTTIIYNTFSNIGHEPIYVQLCGETNIKYNYIKSANTNMADTGSVYISFCSDTVLSEHFAFPMVEYKTYIRNNIIDQGRNLDANGFDFIGTNNYSTNGIYVDRNVKGVEIDSNYINDHFYALFIKGSNHEIRNNTLLIDTEDLVNSVFYGLSDLDGLEFINNIISNNLFIVSALNMESAYVYYLQETDESCSFNGNKYYYPYGHEIGDDYFWKLRFGVWGNTQFLDFQDWLDDQSRIDWGRTGEQLIEPSLWTNSVKDQENFLYVITNPTNVTLTVTEAELPYSDYIDLDGVAFGTSREIPAYGSLVIVRTED